MIIREKNIILNVDDKEKVIGTLYQKKHRVILDLGGYKFKTEHQKKKDNASTFDEVLTFTNESISEVLTPSDCFALFFQDPSCTFDMLRVVVYPDMTVTAHDLDWLDRSHTVKDLHKYYKKQGITLI